MSNSARNNLMWVCFGRVVYEKGTFIDSIYCLCYHESKAIRNSVKHKHYIAIPNSKPIIYQYNFLNFNRDATCYFPLIQ